MKLPVPEGRSTPGCWSCSCLHTAGSTVLLALPQLRGPYQHGHRV